MDIKTLLDNLHDEVSCSVCMCTFTDPKQLPCFHSYCLQCLSDIQRPSGVQGKIKAFSTIFCVAGKNLSVPHSQQVRWLFSQPAERPSPCLPASRKKKNCIQISAAGLLGNCGADSSIYGQNK